MTQSALSVQVQAKNMLHELGIPVYLTGYKALCIAVPLFAKDSMQFMTKELYPAVAKQMGNQTKCGVERAIRKAIADAWNNRNPVIWEKYFPNQKRPPTNKMFIAVLVDRME